MMEISRGRMHLSTEEEIATGHDSPVPLGEFSTERVYDRISRRAIMVEEMGNTMPVPNSVDNIVSERYIANAARYDQAAHRVLGQFAEHMGLSDQTDPVNDLLLAGSGELEKQLQKRSHLTQVV